MSAGVVLMALLGRFGLADCFMHLCEAKHRVAWWAFGFRISEVKVTKPPT